jgi:DNA-directed RNA polymerase delta subunit
MTFSDVVKAIKSLSTDEKQEIQLLLKQYLCEERREEIHTNLKSALFEQQKGELKFSSNINELRQLARGIIVEVSFSASFKRAFKKRIKGNVDLEARFWEKLEQ